LEIGLLQSFPIAGTHRGVKLQLVFFGLGGIVVFIFGRQRFLYA
jgi:hypothetical protein